MPYKLCPYCKRVSYSASTHSEIIWICPYCEEDITCVDSHDSPEDLH